MPDYVALFNDLLHRLDDNPRITMLERDFRPNLQNLVPEEIKELDQYLAKKYGLPFPLPAEDRQLVAFPYRLDIAWETAKGVALPAGVGGHTGCLNLANVAASLSSHEFRKHLEIPGYVEQTPEMLHATMFDCGSRANITTSYTYLRYDREHKRYLGLGLEYSLKFYNLPLTIGEYVRAALAWHGGWGWPFLYLSLDDFRQLDGSTLLTLYDLCEAMPVLFPDADWSIIDTKAEYFAIARPHAENYRRNRA